MSQQASCCYICGRQKCMPMLHRAEQQRAFEKAEKAYKDFLAVQKQCQKEWLESEDDED